MTQKEKDLLLKDLCSRLNTNLVCSIYRADDEGIGYRDEILHGYCKGDIWYEFYFREDCSIGIDNVSKIKPYLLPLSSMTEEQKREYNSLKLDLPTYYYEYGDFMILPNLLIILLLIILIIWGLFLWDWQKTQQVNTFINYG